MEVCNTMAIIAAPNSYHLAAVKRSIDGLNSIQTLLKMDTAQQRLNWYAKHYFGGSDEGSKVDPMASLAPLKSEEAENGRKPAEDTPLRVSKQGSGAPEAVSMHRAEFEKIRREHVDTFSELSSQIQELQHGKLRDVEDEHRFGESLRSRSAESPRYVYGVSASLLSALYNSITAVVCHL